VHVGKDLQAVFLGRFDKTDVPSLGESKRIVHQDLGEKEKFRGVKNAGVFENDDTVRAGDMNGIVT